MTTMTGVPKSKRPPSAATAGPLAGGGGPVAGALPSAPQHSGSFEVDAQAALAKVCAAAGRLMRSAPSRIERAADLHRALNVRPSLGWEFFKLATAESPLAAVIYVPKADPMAKIIQAARTNGFGKQAADELARAYAHLETVVSRHAPDRATFDAMVAALAADDAPDQVGLRQRKGAFQHNAQVWGFYSAAAYACSVWHDGTRAGTQSDASTGGVIGLRQLRKLPSVTLTSRGRIVTPTSGAEGADVASTEMQLLEEFSSKPLPSLEVVNEGKAWREIIQLTGVGKGHATTCLFTQSSGVNMPREDFSWGLARLLCIPTEVQVLDLLVPRGWADPETLSIATYGNPADIMAVLDLPERHRMPCREEARHLGSTIDALHDPDVPRAPDVVRTLLVKQGWQNTVFDIFRCRIRYPIFHAMNIMQVRAKAGAEHGSGV